MALTGQEVLNAVNKMPLGQKVGVVAGVVILLSAANWYFFIDPMQTQITQRQGTLHALEDELIQKQSIANNLAQFKHEKEILERRLAQALTELPNEANIDDLIRSLSEIGTKSGLAINSIEPQAEQRQSFYASIPIVMAVSGNYHEIGVFLDSLSKLARIVNVTNIKMGQARVTNEKLVINANYIATTFRFLPEANTPRPAK
ncbi:MAG: pilus assembly protein PilO [Deltaproteobacteria bacterium]|nr:MAG: pilus assembly protein PilO [Deltaproteobacteria bacterium]TMB24587.1 MAG: pilus assembly protein PilO [Deltaproteobacteria bacterium]